MNRKLQSDQLRSLQFALEELERTKASEDETSSLIYLGSLLHGRIAAIQQEISISMQGQTEAVSAVKSNQTYSVISAAIH
jgi:hypothetical protein